MRLSDTKGTEPDVTLQICKQRCLNQARCNFILFGINIWYTANRCVLFTSCDNPIEYASGDPKVYRRPSSGNKTKLSIKRNHVILFSTLLLLKHKLLIFPQFSDTCNIISVTNASYADCNGLYGHQKNLSVDWAPLKAVYKHLFEERYIFWREVYGYRTEWLIGPKTALSTGSSFYKSK